MADETVLTEDEIEAIQRDSILEQPDRTSSDAYPRLANMSAGMMYKAVIRAQVPEPAEYVTIKISTFGRDALAVHIAQWNLLWEAAQFRRRFFDEDDLPKELAAVADRGDLNVVFVPRTPTRYHEYAPLYHLLPRGTAERHGLPLLRRGLWPFLAEHTPVDDHLPVDFEARLSRAWADVIWRHLVPGSPLSSFSGTEPIRLLAHNLDFRLPPVTEVMQQTLRTFPTVDNGIVEGPPPLIDGGFLDGAVAANPRMGSDLWCGEEEAAQVVAATVEQADAGGRLRGILDAVRSNRVEDDFSNRWSYAREDFERKLYHKRSKVKVRIVELTDTIPVQGPESEIVDRLVFGDFLALLDERDRQVVVLLRSGVTKLTDIAHVMGYRNHSPISKRLKQICDQAARFFND
jgi:hypothetical protein